MLLVLHRAQLHLYAGGLLLRRDSGDIQLADLGHVLHQELVPVRDRLGLGLEFLGVLGEVGGPAREDLVHGFVTEAGLGGWGGSGGGGAEQGGSEMAVCSVRFRG